MPACLSAHSVEGRRSLPTALAQRPAGQPADLPDRRGFDALPDHAARRQRPAAGLEPAAFHLPAAATSGAPVSALVSTGVPLISESDGLTMTASVGFKPETISTESP